MSVWALRSIPASAGVITSTVSKPTVKENTNGTVDLVYGVTGPVFDPKTKQKIEAIIPLLTLGSVPLGPKDDAKSKRNALFDAIQKNPNVPMSLAKLFTKPGDTQIVLTDKELPQGSALVLDAKNSAEALDTFNVKDGPTAALVAFRARSIRPTPPINPRNLL